MNWCIWCATNPWTSFSASLWDRMFLMLLILCRWRKTALHMCLSYTLQNLGVVFWPGHVLQSATRGQGNAIMHLVRYHIYYLVGYQTDPWVHCPGCWTKLSHIPEEVRPARLRRAPIVKKISVGGVNIQNGRTVRVPSPTGSMTLQCLLQFLGSETGFF